MPKFDNILDTIGNTPSVRVRKLAPEGINLYVKLEAFNPMGSVKDRLALGIIEDAERSGTLNPGQTVIEATSGNTGIGLAMVCAHKGYPLVVVMAENFSVERRKLLRFLGARVILTPAAAKGSGMLAKAVELAQAHGWFLCRQFDNEANADAHSRTTAQEILADFQGERLDYWVSGYGTGGTLKGVGRMLREQRPATRIIVCEPDNSPVLASGIPQRRTLDGSPAESHPNFRPHLMQGWAPDFIPKLTEDAVALGLIDQIVPINGADALRLARELACREGIFTGISGGATFAGALKIADSAPAGTTILCMLPDTGERYLSTPLFADISADMNADELTISRSTPRFRFDVQTGSAPAAAAAAAVATIAPAPVASPAPPPPVQPPSPDVESPGVDKEAANFVSQVINDAQQPVVMFALEWCEFCWALRKMFARFEIPYRSIDLDSVAYQSGGRGGRIRTALAARTAMNTIPQVFFAGEFIGGCTETLDAFKAGRLQQIMDRTGIAFNGSQPVDPYSFLPTWLHPRS